MFSKKSGVVQLINLETHFLTSSFFHILAILNVYTDIYTVETVKISTFSTFIKKFYLAKFRSIDCLLILNSFSF